MAISQNLDDLERSKFIESSSTPGQPGIAIGVGGNTTSNPISQSRQDLERDKFVSDNGQVSVIFLNPDGSNI